MASKPQLGRSAPSPLASYAYYGVSQNYMFVYTLY